MNNHVTCHKNILFYFAINTFGNKKAKKIIFVKKKSTKMCSLEELVINI